MSVFRYLDTEELEIRNSLFLLNSNALAADADDLDIGFTGVYGTSGTLKYTGLFRDASDGIYKLYEGLTDAPTAAGVVDTGGAGYVKASLWVEDFHAYGDGIFDGDLTISGDVVSINVETLNVEDNIIVANSGPANTKEDGGFVVRRQVAAIALDTPKFTGTANAAGTTTTLQLATQTSRVVDFYKGWVVTLAVTSTETVSVLSSTTGVNPILTLDATVAAATDGTTTYSLFNQVYVGTIWDESTNMNTSYGFPREDLIGVIDPAGNAADGNLADYIDVRAGNVHVESDLYVTGVVKASLRIEDNITAGNSGGAIEDHGYVTERSPANIVAQDTAKLTGTAQGAGTTTTLALPTQTAVSTDYYEGWVMKLGVTSTETVTVVSSTSGTDPILTFTPAASVATDGTTTYSLYNKVYVGTIYDESTDTMMMVGFPREVGETVIDPVAPVNGNIPDYINLAVNDLTVNGAFVTQITTLTQVGAVTFTAAQFFANDIIYLNPSGDTTYTLPTIASLALGANKSKMVMFVNIGTDKAIISRNSTDTLEGLTTLGLNKLYSKTVLTASSEHAGYFTIKG